MNVKQSYITGNRKLNNAISICKKCHNGIYHSGNVFYNSDNDAICLDCWENDKEELKEGDK